MSAYSAVCVTCGAVWTDGGFTPDCEECGGGHLQRPCIICGGRCGATMTRAVDDSNDSGIAHWAGRCRLPDDEQAKLLGYD